MLVVMLLASVGATLLLAAYQESRYSDLRLPLFGLGVFALLGAVFAYKHFRL